MRTKVNDLPWGGPWDREDPKPWDSPDEEEVANA